jgi:metal-responsive CopG/Arc/MetJ family transcriptional regulator
MSGSETTTLRLNDTRKRRLDRVEEEIDKNSRAGAIDEATKHYLRAREDLEELAGELEQRFQAEADERALGTWELDVEVSVVEE